MNTLGSLRLPVSSALATVLASIALGSVFLRERWFFPALFAVVITTGVAEVARRMSAPRSFVPLAGLLGLIVYLVFLYARDEAILGVVRPRTRSRRCATCSTRAGATSTASRPRSGSPPASR